MDTAQTQRTETPTPTKQGEVSIVPFGPGSLLWEWGGDARGGIFGPAVGFLQGAHPVVAAGIRDHSVVWTNPYMRGWNSTVATLRWVYGGEKAFKEAKLLRDIHKDIAGEGLDGKRYHALNPEPFAWVWATGWVAYVGTLRTFSRETVTRDLEEQLYEEFKNLGRILGVRERLIPVTLDDFETYFEGMLARFRDDLVVDDELIEQGLALFACPPPPPHVPMVVWRPIGQMSGRVFFFFAAAYGPEQLREQLRDRMGYEWTAKRERRLRRLVTVMNKTNPFLPELLRYLPYAYIARRRARRTPLSQAPS